MAQPKITQGADKAIVAGMTRASAGNVPGDYSKIYQGMADSYSKTMQANSKMWGEVINAAVEIAKPMVAKAGERRRAEIDVRSSPNSEKLIAELDGFKAERRETWKGDFLSKENIASRRDIGKRKDEFFSAVKEQKTMVDNIDSFLESEQFDAKAMGVYRLEVLDAYQGSSTTGEKTSRGNYFQSRYDKKTKKIIHTLMHDPSAVEPGIKPLMNYGSKIETGNPGTKAYPVDPAAGQFGNNKPYALAKIGTDEEITFTNRQIQQLMIPKDDNLKPGLRQIFDSYTDQGYKTGGEFTEYESNKAKNDINKLLEAEGATDRFIHEKWGGIDKSFYEELTSESGLTASIWGALSNSLPGDGQGNLFKQGMLANIDDMADGNEGIQQSDFLGENAQDNMIKIQTAYLNPGSPNYVGEQKLKETAVEWAAGVNGKLSSSWNAGRKYNKSYIRKLEEDALANNLNNLNNDTPKDRFASIGDTKSLGLAGVYVNKGELENKRTAIQQRRGFPIGGGIIFNPKGKNSWVKLNSDGEVIGEYSSVSDLIKTGLGTNHPGFTSLITMDVDGDGKADGPTSLDFLNKDYYKLIGKK